VNFICRAAGDAQLAQVGRSVARMAFTTPAAARPSAPARC
jgi:hypothetical protein